MDNIDIDIVYGKRISSQEAAALTIDLLCANMTTWVRAIENNTGERYYKEVRDNLDKWYLEPHDNEPEIDFK